MQKNYRVLYLLALLKFSLPFFLQNGVYEPHRDELLYLAEGQHMAWGFMEVPPMLSVFAWLTHLFGGSMFWIKFWPSLFGALTYILVAKLVLSLGGKTYSLVLAFFSLFFSAFLRVHFLFQPNFLEVFFYTLIAYALVRYIQTAENRWVYIMGIGMGLGMQSKYSIAFFIIGVCVGLALTKQRKIFANKHFYYAAALALLIFLPNVIWQVMHRLPVVYHMDELRRTQLQYISPVSFIVGQFIMFLPAFFVWIAGLWFITVSKKGRDYRFLGIAYFTVIILLLFFQGKSYYSLGLYPPLFGFGAYYLESLTATRMRALRYVRLTIITALGLLFVPIALPILPPAKLARLYRDLHAEKTGTLKWEDLKNHPLPQDFADMLSWKEMAQKMAAAYATLDSNEKKHTLLFCDNYGMAGAVNYYGGAYHLPEAYSDNASFLYWMPDSVHIDNIILLTDDKEEMQHSFIKDFHSAVLYDSITTPFAREQGDLLIILKGANDQFNKMFAEKIAKDRSDK